MGDTKRTYTKKELGGYLVGMFGQNLIYNIVATGLYFYFQNKIIPEGFESLRGFLKTQMNLLFFCPFFFFG